MPLSSLVLSRDWQEISVLECILASLHIDVTVEREPHQALTRLSRSKIDALIVDCDLNGTSQFLRKLPELEKQKQTVPLVLMGGARQVRAAEDAGALFAFEKPISVEQAVRTLSAARNLIVDGRLRYHRAGVTLPVWISVKGERDGEAQLVNVSQGGMQIHTDLQVEALMSLQIAFKLPRRKATLKAQAQVVWTDQRGNVGVRFVKIAPTQQKALQLWLAQQFLAN
jgi:FixJ family two-component response regulator